MPIYGREKTKQMVRSVLPSTARKDAKKRKDMLHRRNRRTTKNHIHNYRGSAEDLYNGYEDDNYDYEYWSEPHRDNIGGWDDIVFDRRMNDKLAHFETWAYLKTKDLPSEDRFKKIAALMSGVLGTHALSHLEFLKFDPINDDPWHDNLPRQLRHRNYTNKFYTDLKTNRELIEKAVRGIARNDKKRKEFNDFLVKNAITDIYTYRKWIYDKAYQFGRTYFDEKVEYTGSRTLNGYHDATKFLRDIYATQKLDSVLGYHPSWLNLVKRYFNIK